jgi:hypothetical protein
MSLQIVRFAAFPGDSPLLCSAIKRTTTGGLSYARCMGLAYCSHNVCQVCMYCGVRQKFQPCKVAMKESIIFVSSNKLSGQADPGNLVQSARLLE